MFPLVYVTLYYASCVHYKYRQSAGAPVCGSLSVCFCGSMSLYTIVHVFIVSFAHSCVCIVCRWPWTRTTTTTTTTKTTLSTIAMCWSDGGGSAIWLGELWVAHKTYTQIHSLLLGGNRSSDVVCVCDEFVSIATYEYIPRSQLSHATALTIRTNSTVSFSLTLRVGFK